MKLSIIKIGGNIIDKPAALKQFLADFAKIEGHKILVHGGGVVANAVGKQLGIVSLMKEGRRVTDAETLKLVTMVYAGSVNKEIVAALQALGQNALGLTGADGNLVQSEKRAPKPIDYGFVGDVIKVNTDLLNTLFEANIIPVVSPITHDGSGQLLNTNADTMAGEIAIAVADIYETSLFYCFEKHGVLQDVNKENSVISNLSYEDYLEMKASGSIVDGMLPKLENAFSAHQKGIKVWIGHASKCLLAAENKAVGTLLIKNK